MDLTGAGHADILITEDEVIHWYPSLGDDGFGPRETVRLPPDEAAGPRVIFQDAAEAIFLADISGDGLSDLVRIRNAEICYWPNLGYGRFGAKVTMDGAPCSMRRSSSNQRRIRLADIDGTGTVDLIYLGADGVRLYFNRSGNGWTAAAPAHQLSAGRQRRQSISVPDLLGNGTACLVWSSALPGHAHGAAALRRSDGRSEATSVDRRREQPGSPNHDCTTPPRRGSFWRTGRPGGPGSRAFRSPCTSSRESRCTTTSAAIDS